MNSHIRNNLANEQLIHSASILIEKFIQETNSLKHFVRVKYYAKKRDHGFKLFIVVRNSENNGTITNTSMKIRSPGQLRILRCTLKSIIASIRHYICDISNPGSDTDVITVCESE